MLTPVTVAASVVAIGLIAAIGGWMRRWMSDDGLIVLRTVRNLLAGNGPVFNAGERVEANTSTLWQYLITLGSLISDARLETIALWLALILTVLAGVIAAVGAAWFHGLRSGLVYLPLGGLIYFALPPARDFATSGLEWGLSIFWLAVWWVLLVWWVTYAHEASRSEAGRHRLPSGPPRDWPTYILAFWCGLSWLVRPELALYGGVTGIVLLVAVRRPHQIAGILAAALPVPLGYQIFRMGYYGLLTPHTAVAKSASDAQWEAGFEYLHDLNSPYLLVIPIVAALVAAAALLLRAAGGRGERDVVADGVAESATAPGWRGVLRTRAGIAALVPAVAVLHIAYVLRVGGDFMHARMWLLPLFAILMPVMVVPVVDYYRGRTTDVLALLAAAVVVVWAWIVMSRGTDHVDWQDFEAGGKEIVDEREFWTYHTGRERGNPPLVAADFTDVPEFGTWPQGIEEMLDDNAAVMMPYAIDGKKETGWYVIDRAAGDTESEHLPPSAYHLNLGMTSANAPLNVRVLDTVGLATPLAARQPRDEDGRIGHDKTLPWAWQVADTDADVTDIPGWIDVDDTLAARAALRTPEISELLASYREPMSAQRFFSNIAWAFGSGRSLEVPEDGCELLDDHTIARLERQAAEIVSQG
ncbi:hypothetical protein C3B44_10945 [Corynebacterium yudongzhengii]|uniref:Terminal beta-(1->2)-arabinofuranosyltransferase C-terminal domain-containing protein n=1 Tax=Corynebacterium yudongzhengii TaxID=2080740 RepID=A0A2U1T8A4_9CORY|nr:hypothetical protein C3B44_10945 [Corynebacterium yudongzhengii]PWC02223.1 hypothetical protein DF222_03450 [Corynebacterium yudongzhengii]